MKKLFQGVTVLLVFGSFILLNCENVEAATLEDLTTDKAEIQEMAHRHYPPPPIRGVHRNDHYHNYNDHHHNPHHYDGWKKNPPPPIHHRHKLPHYHW